MTGSGKSWYKNGRAVKLVSRAGKDHTRRFPDLVAALAVLKPPTLILEGEVAIFDSQLVSHFEWFRTKPQGPATPPVFMVQPHYREGERGWEPSR